MGSMRRFPFPISSGRPPVLRVAYPSNDLQALLPFYIGGLGLEVLSRFHDHDGFDGVILGRSGWPYHLEFTRRLGHAAEGPPSGDNLLVFYHPRADDWRRAVRRMTDAGFAPVPSLNPYWDRSGLTFQDPEGRRVVIQNDSGSF